MTVLFTADWHIKLGQKNIPKEWALARYYEFFDQIYELEKEVDVHIIGGDIFDRIPTVEELEIFFRFIQGVKKPTYVYDGNHEATKKNHTFLSNLKEVTKAVNNLVRIIDEPLEDPMWSSTMGGYTILPYCYLHRKGSIEVLDQTKPLFTHVRGNIPPHVHSEIDLERLSKFPVVFAGDLHSHSNTQSNIVYPGSPMTTTFHRSRVETGYIIIYDNWEWAFGTFKLPQLIRKTIKSPSEMIPGIYDHVIYEIEGDLTELAKVENTALLDKKVVKRQTEASLLLGKDMGIAEELNEYLLYILEIPEEKISEILKTYNDYV